ncbi:MAG: tRNA uridine-5-carboxymethylaminomethyl(34) synthesis GTPase MnmE, partial [Candidatus Puniceispirillaceae bacterium]
MSNLASDTIFAIATPPGRSAIAVIRISGSNAASAPALLRAACPPAGQFSVARLYHDGQVIDQALLLFMK